MNVGTAFTPTNASSQTVAFSSSNTGVATVDAVSGLVTARATGLVNIIVTCLDAGHATGHFQLLVIANN
jgi:uncharacterized protein YjdB